VKERSALHVAFIRCARMCEGVETASTDLCECGLPYPHTSWFMRVRFMFSLTIRVLQHSARCEHILSLDRFVHSNPGDVPSAAQIPTVQVNRCHTFNQSFEKTTLGTIPRPQSPHVQSTQRVHVTIFKLVKQSTQSLIQLKSRHYGLITSPTLTYLICCMQKREEKKLERG